MRDMEKLTADLGLTYRQLDYWVRKGWLQPEHAQCGSGTHRQFDGQELVIARRMSRLVGLGFEPSLAARVARSSMERRSHYYSLMFSLSALSKEAA